MRTVCSLFALLFFQATSSAGLITLSFESLVEDAVLGSQFAPLGVVATGQPVVYTAGSKLNEIDFPPRSGVNVLVDVNGPIGLEFSDAPDFLSAYVTYTTPLTFKVFGPGGILLSTTTSVGVSNLGSSEYFSFSLGSGEISALTISGDVGGSSFIVDDVTFGSVAAVPEPGTRAMLIIGFCLAGWLASRRRRHRLASSGIGRNPGLSSRVLATLLAVMVLGQTLSAQGVRRFNNILAVPDLVYTATPTTVTLITNVEPNAALIVDSITLNEVSVDGQLIRVIGRMYDDGSHGDALANDYNYTVQITVSQSTPTKLYFRATAAYRGVIARALSQSASVSVAPPSFSAPPDPAKLVTSSSGGVFPANQVLITVPDGTPRASVDAVVGTIGGHVVGFSSSTNVYQAEVPATTAAQLEALISSLLSSPLVVNVSRNYLTSFNAAVDVDLTRLKAANSANTAAYDKIQTIGAFQSLVDLGTKFASVRVGVLDTGVLGTHEEFAGVHLVGASTDPNGHGTSVASIIGANNRTAFGSYPAGQMNGILAGIPSASNTSGSTVPYTIDSRQTGAVMDVLAGIDNLAADGTRVINMSFAWTKEGPLAAACAAALKVNPVNAAEFADITNKVRQSIQARKSILFVAAAGNYGIDASNTSPANIDEPNVITVGATDPSDARAIWTPSFNGISGCNSASNWGANVDLSAPGTNVYAASITPAKWEMFGGTSAAAPLVSGAAGLLLAINTGLEPQKVADILKKTGDKIADQSIGGVRLNVKVASRFLAQPVDLFLVVDETGSFSDDLATFKSQSAGLIQKLIDEKLNIYIGLARFEDYPINPWGAPTAGDRPYTRVSDLISAVEDTNNNTTPDIIDAINSLSTRDGNDWPEAQLVALYQMATGAGQNGPAGTQITAGQQANWRENSLRLAILWTDASFHRPGDSGSFPYPGPSFGDTINALNAKSIKVVGILAGGDSAARVDLTTVASGTSALAPEPGVDCDGNGAIDVPVGSPMVCQISTTGNGIAQAVVNAVVALAKK